MKRVQLAIVGAGLLATGAVLAQSGQQGSAAPVAPARPSFLSVQGYMPKGAMPDSLLINPLPPAAKSAAEARDVAAAKAAVKLHGTPRWTLAIRDAEIFRKDVTSTFSCAAGVAIGPDTTPKTEQLMLRVARDLGASTYPTKTKFMRKRPFMVNGAPQCTPDMDAVLRKDGSYPSGHAAIGFGWGLLLAEVIPDRAGPLVARGRAFADSRRICNVHWLSDTEEGSFVASAVLARLHAEPAFLADAAAARAEIAALAGKALPAEDCAAQAAAIAMK